METHQKATISALLLIAFATSCIDSSSAQTFCNMSGQELMACKPSVTPPNPPKPSAECCSGLKHADMQCLCSYKNSNLLSSFGIDPNLAMKLPQMCKFPHPVPC
ncbi:hypothetical protein M9H77_15275 [Catharanthus roseus]|uniref:Uncharacterized protein n=1 Tax=Catharanthus roseus TaxID=4058 RepID=A0ACC0AYA6_CATRO|nr:hypothetical protein M9H77_15275 [Catharanthus roseus]